MELQFTSNPIGCFAVWPRMRAYLGSGVLSGCFEQASPRLNAKAMHSKLHVFLFFRLRRAYPDNDEVRTCPVICPEAWLCLRVRTGASLASM